MITAVPEQTGKTYKMPPLKHRCVTVEELVAPINTGHRYKSQKDFCDELIDAQRRLWNFVLVSNCATACITILLMKYFG